MPPAAGVPALLTMPHYTGTLATARQLAERGVEVVVAADRLLAPALWSRHVSKRERFPAVARGPEQLAAWLCGYGRRNGGAVLYPTSDDIAWVVSRYADRLGQHFHLFAPPMSAMRSLLDKSALYEVCTELGVPTPKSWFPRSELELAGLFDDGRALLLKPRAQMFFSGGKGERLEHRAQAIAAWRAYRAAPYAPGILVDFPSLDLPLVQEYEPTAAQGTYSISGFIEPSGQILGARASTKLLQTARVGVGMCFVASEVDREALRSVERVAKRVGYFGVFEVEFVKRDGQCLLIDFNPRYYGQMGFDIARGVPLPWLVHNAAQGYLGELEQLVSSEASADAPTLYWDRLALAWWLGTALVSGAMRPREARRWYRTMDELSLRSLEASWTGDDPLPAVVKVAAMACAPLRSPLTFLRSLRDSSDFSQQPITRSS
jgi:predicted ATP-grasp superfamily ATP-dependent carboligase